MSKLSRVLLWGYVPFLCGIAAGSGALLLWLIPALPSSPLLSFPCLVVIFLLAATLFHFARALTILPKCRQIKDDSELRFPRDQLEGLYDLVHQVARDRRISAPAEIRLSADSVAHVYEDDNGLEILVLGGFALASFSREMLQGIIAHELGHFAAGDTRLSRRSFKRGLYMRLLDCCIGLQPGAAFNPVLWIVRAYHLLFWLVWAASSRRQEVLADQQEVQQIGRKQAAASLLYVTVMDGLPWLRISSIAQSFVSTGQPLDRIFAEQVRRAQHITPAEWEDACRKELRKATDVFATHPALRDRLAAMGVTRRQALKLMPNDSGAPARTLLPQWEQIEKRMTAWLMACYQAEHQAKMEYAAIVLGRLVSRP